MLMNRRIIFTVIFTIINILATYLIHENVAVYELIKIVLAIPYFMFYIPVLLLISLGLDQLTTGDYYSLYLTKLGWAVGVILMFIFNYFVTYFILNKLIKKRAI